MTIIDHCQYEVTFVREHGETCKTINYRVLERIMEFTLGAEAVWGDLRNTIQLVAEITLWRTNGEDVALSTVTFKRVLASIVTDLRNIRGVVGRVESQGEWGIIDRNMGLACGTFVTQGGLSDDSDGDD